MTNLLRKSVQESVVRRIELTGSQNRAAKELGISAAQLMNIRKGEWKFISDRLINKVASQLNIKLTWQTAETRNYKRVINICTHAQQNSVSRAISFAPGTGKSYTLREYAQSNPNTYYFECEEYWTKKEFLRQTMKALGIDEGQMSIAERVDVIIDTVNKMQKPLIIIDEADKLKDSVLNLYKTLYNKTSAGYVLAGTPYFRERVMKGVQKAKMGFQEIYSRVGGEFLPLYKIDRAAIEKICRVNGITDQEEINEVAQLTNGDLRRTRATIEKINLKRKKNETADA